MSSPNGTGNAARPAVARCVICKIGDASTLLIPGERDYAMLAEVASISNLINPIDKADPLSLVLCHECGTMCRKHMARSASNRQQAPANPSNTIPETESIKSSPASERDNSPLPPFTTLLSPHRNVHYDLRVNGPADVEMLANNESVSQKLPAPQHQEQYGEPIEPLAGAEILLGCELTECQRQEDVAMEHSGCADVQQRASVAAPVPTGEPDEPPYPTAPTPAYTFADIPRAEERAAKRREEQTRAAIKKQLQQELKRQQQLLRQINRRQQELQELQHQHPQSSGSSSAVTEHTVAETEAGASGLISAAPTQDGAPEQANLPAVQSEPLDYSIRQQQEQPLQSQQRQQLQQENQQTNQLIEKILHQELVRRRQLWCPWEQESPLQEQPQQQEHQHSRSDPAGATDDGARCLVSQGVLPTIGTLEQRKDPGDQTTPVDYSIGQQEEQQQQRQNEQYLQYVSLHVRKLCEEQQQLAQQLAQRQQLQQHQQSSPDSAVEADAGARSLASAGLSQQGDQQQQQQQQQVSGNLSAAPGHQEAGTPRGMDSAGSSLDGVPPAGAPGEGNLPANQSSPMDSITRQQQQPGSSDRNVPSANNHAAPLLDMNAREQLSIPHKCERCNTELGDFYEYRRHLYELHDLLQCKYCKLYFNVYFFEQHLHQCFGRTAYCLICKSWFPLMTFLTEHTHANFTRIDKSRPIPKPRDMKKQCHVCGRYYSRTYVNQHIRTQHPSAE